MKEEIVNRVANSALVTLDLEEYYPAGKRIFLDLKQWLYEGFILKEKDFRAALKAHNWDQYKDCYVAVGCSTDAILPSWAILLVTTYLQPFAKLVAAGDLETLEVLIFAQLINDFDVTNYENKPVIIKGCSDKSIPESAYVLLTQKVQSVAKSVMFGEACSTVPLYKKPK